MRIAFVTDGLYPDHIGGIQKYSLQLIIHLAKHGAFVDVFLQNESPEGNKMLEGFSNIKVHKIDCRASALPGKYLRNIKIFSKAVFSEIAKTGNVDIVYCQGFTGWMATMKGDTGTPVVVNLHGLEMYQETRGIRARLVKWYFRNFVNRLIKSAEYAVVLGTALEKIMLGVNSKLKTAIIPNGVSDTWLDYFKNKNKAGRIRKFIFVGRYEWRKGLDTLNCAIEELNQSKTINWEMHFVGFIPEKKQIRSENVFYHGSCNSESEMAEYYATADVLVCPSYSEGMPTVILEAMAAGLAVIGTDVGATSEMLDSNTGILIQPFDAGELKSAMNLLIELKDEDLDKMKENGNQKVRQSFNWNIIAEKHIAYFENIINNR